MGKNTQQKATSVSREFSSGGVVFKKEDGEILWLVTASVPSDLFPNIVWRLPKGWIDDSEKDNPGPMASGAVKADEASLRNAALREVSEEGGISARIVEKIGTHNFFYTHPVRGKILKFVTFYLMEWQNDLPEGFDGETSEIKWLPYKEAYEKLSFSREKEVLKKAKDLLPL